MILEITAWAGSISLAVCGVPIAWDSYRDGHSKGINNIFLGLWFFGEICFMIHTISLDDWPLMVNYGVNILLISVIIRYKLFPRPV